MEMEGESKLLVAVRSNDLKSSKILVEHLANLHSDARYPLRWAARFGYLEVVKYLLERGANLHAENDWALRKSAENGHLEVVECLLEQGANLHANDDIALRYAAEKGYIKVVRHLLEQGANPRSITDRELQKILGDGNRNLINLLLLYNLQIENRSPDLISSFLKIRTRGLGSLGKNKLIASYRRKILSKVERLLYHLYYRPGSLAFFRALDCI